MSMPPTHFLNDLGPQAQAMAKDCKNERMAMILQSVAIGSMIIMTGVAATQLLREAFGSRDHDRGRSR
jgi:tRNA A37 threonylcarbamoyltransferase TsaD